MIQCGYAFARREGPGGLALVPLGYDDGRLLQVVQALRSRHARGGGRIKGNDPSG